MDVTNYEKSLDKNKPKEINVSPDSLYKKVWLMNFYNTYFVVAKEIDD